jgi:hypothetical protein
MTVAGDWNFGTAGMQTNRPRPRFAAATVADRSPPQKKSSQGSIVRDDWL